MRVDNTSLITLIRKMIPNKKRYQQQIRKALLYNYMKVAELALALSFSLILQIIE
jgi:hypothetical protein